jgi:hypothetical protein
VSEARAEVTAALFTLQQAFEDLVVRGVKSAGADDVKHLQAIGEEFGRSGAGYMAQRLADLVHAAREGDDGASRMLLRAQTASRVFERVLSLDAAAEAFADGSQPSVDHAESRTPPPLEDKRALLPVLVELANVVEGLVASGLTTASAATRQKLDASAKEAARLKLGRLSASLRYVNDELGRFLAESTHFSPRRLAFFLIRTWLIARGLKEAIDEDNHDALAKLLWTSAPKPVKALRLVTVGVQKRALLDGSASFDFRFRTVAKSDELPQGARVVWSCVFAGKKDVPAEAFLHLPQAQKFLPKLLLDRNEVLLTDAAVAVDDSGLGRLMLGPRSTVKAGAAFKGYDEFLTWDKPRALERIRRHQVTPLDLEVELQEDVVVSNYELGAPAPNPYKPEQSIFPLTVDGFELDVTVSTGPDGEELTKALKAMSKKGATRPPLFGLMHYEMCRLVFQPLATFGDKGPQHLMISSDKIDLASLMKTLDFST